MFCLLQRLISPGLAFCRSEDGCVFSFPAVGPRASSCFFRQHEIGEVLEDPIVLQSSIDNAEQLARQRDDRLASAAPRLGFS